MDQFVCDRCGSEIERFEVTAFGDDRPRFVPGRCACSKPCPFCEATLDQLSRCTGFDCFMFGLPIPIPELL